MSETPDPRNASLDVPCNDHDALRLLSRSPHPYHRQNHELLEPSSPLSPNTDNSWTRNPTATAYPAVSRESTSTSDSGTEADDEHFLKGLPAPRTKLHKGLRGRNEIVSGTSTPVLSPALLEEDGRRASYLSHISKKHVALGKATSEPIPKSRRNRNVIRRLTECLLLGCLGGFVQANGQVRPILTRWRSELLICMGVTAFLGLLYPLRLIHWGYKHRSPSHRIPLAIPTLFDPAAFLYPPAITLLVSSLVSVDNETVLLPNIVLSICSLPPALFPSLPRNEPYNLLHWLLACAPIFLSRKVYPRNVLEAVHDANGQHFTAPLAPEVAVLLYPLHQSLCMLLHSLTTTSLLIAELQLLSVALIDVLFLSRSPQATIIKAMLWIGGLDILVLCSQVVKWGISLARVPKWRFRRPRSSSKGMTSSFSFIISWRKIRHDLLHVPMDSSACSSCSSMDDHSDTDEIGYSPPSSRRRIRTLTFDGGNSSGLDGVMLSGGETTSHDVRLNTTDTKLNQSPLRRHTLPVVGSTPKKSPTHTPSGRRKRSASSSVRAFFSLTQRQATVRKWLYAAYIYVCVFAIVFVPHPIVGVKNFVQLYALHGFEPVGWALGYLFGDFPSFRLEVLTRNLESWICLPPRIFPDSTQLGSSDWVQQLRHVILGDANTRLLLSAYYLCIISLGILVVFRLSPFYEVDTRRKVFHFMMVAMFLPSIYIDPTFAALAMSIVLALFLLLDLLRASQLPPLSKPLANFLAPYVDGRDLRGPVVISHIFLLIGCAIPLWLSLASLPRSGTGYIEGWEIPTREVSMVSGVICVGLGDAAASLIGRRWGHRKWLWGGGKSLEGSLAFATAVFIGLIVAQVWLRVGGWTPTTVSDGWGMTIQKSGVCASMASLTEAVLTGGNDNVVVPVVLWTCVKTLGV